MTYSRTHREIVNNRLSKLAEIYKKSNTLDEYKCNADLEGISRKNYLWLFDPFVFFYIQRQFGHLPRFAIAVLAFFISLSVWLVLSCHPIFACITSVLFSWMTLGAYDIGVHIASNMLEES